MKIKPKIRGFICTTAHSVGCEQMVKNQIDYVKSQGGLQHGPKRVLIIGASTGYGLASRIVSAFGLGAQTLGVAYERPAGKGRTASPGWYNTAALEKFAQQEDLYAKSINGDAFSDEIKEQTLSLIKDELGQVDLVIYSLAAPRRKHPVSGQQFSSTLKPVGQRFTNKSVDPIRGEVKEVSLEPASEDEINQTIAVMGGEDWALWMDRLLDNNLLSQGATTLAYSYIGPQLTYPIYKEGTIGIAKSDLHQVADQLNQRLAAIDGQALISVNKALVTQASAAIPIVPLYISILYRYMKEQGTHEGCIEQIYRLFKTKLFNADKQPVVDSQRLIRMDDFEMAENIQTKVKELWPQVTTENLFELTDIQGYLTDFYQLFGFEVSGVDYEADIAEL